MKPVDGGNHARQTENEPIVAPHMFEFMRERSPHVGFTPSLRVRRKHNRRPQDAAGHRAGCRLVHEDVDGSAKADLMRQLLRHDLRVTPWQTLTTQAANL